MKKVLKPTLAAAEALNVNLQTFLNGCQILKALRVFYFASCVGFGLRASKLA